MDAGTTTISATITRTADTAALCKWSLTRHGYLASAFPQLPPETLSLLASLAGADPSSPPSYRASPLLHWCYALRAKAVLGQVQSFLEKREGGREGGKRRKVVVLGGGMDGLVLALCAGVGVAMKGCKLVEIDVRQVVARKEVALQAWREGGKEGRKEGAVGTFMKEKGSYTLKAADLRDVESVRKVLQEAEEEEEGEEGREEEVLFIFEAVLGYMKPKEVERLLRSLPTTSSSCSLLIIDTGRVAGLKGKDAVAAAVGAAFAKKGCPLEGLGGWRNRQDVQRDLRAWGWKGNIGEQTLWEATQEQREGKGEGEGGREGEVEDEVFDEYAAWHLFAQQSWCIHASSTPPSLPPSLPLSIRPYRPRTTDHAVVMALIEEGREGAKEGRPAVASFVAKALKKDMKLLEEGTYPGGFWVVEEEEEGEGGREGGLAVVGCVGLRVSGKKEGGREGEVVRLSVRKDRRGRGVGLRLLAFVEGAARTWVDGEGGGKEGGGKEGGEEKGRREEENNAGERGRERREGDRGKNSSQLEEGQPGLHRLRVTTLGEDALPGALALYVDRAGWVVERQSTYGGGKGGGGEGILYHLYKDL